MISILLVEPRELVRVGIKCALNAIDGFRVIADTHNGEAALRLARYHVPDVVILNVDMPGIGGIETTRRIVAQMPHARVIAVAQHAPELFAFRLIEIGAYGCLSEASHLDEIISAIRSVNGGDRYIGADTARQMAMSLLPGGPADPMGKLSPRELQVMMMVTQGQKTRDISSCLCLSPKTVSTYRYRLYEKLGVGNDVELTHYALRHGVID